MERQILDVSQVNEYIKGLMDTDELLTGLCIRGELSNYKIYPSGHHYFTLKDAGGALRCVMFRSSAARLRFRPENGMKVLAMGRITVFPRDGAYQLYCSDLTPDGVGDLYVAFEQAGQADDAFAVVDMDDDRFDLVADVHDVLGLDGRIAGEVFQRDVGGVLRAKVDFDLGGTDGHDGASYLISIIQSLEGLLEKLGKILLLCSFNFQFFAHFVVYLLN